MYRLSLGSRSATLRPRRRSTPTIMLILAVALAGTASIAHADDNGPYVGIGATQVELNNIYGVGLHLHDSTPKWIAGVRFADFVGIEVNYANLGSQDAALLGSYRSGYAHADGEQVSAFAMGYLPLPLGDLFAKAGVMHSTLVSNGEIGGTPIYSIDNSTNEFAWGLGGQLHFGPFAPRLEWEHSNMAYASSLNLWTLGVTFTF